MSIGAGSHDDGSRDEGDDVSEVEEVRGGREDDIISQTPGSTAPLKAEGGGGDDTLIGAPGGRARRRDRQRHGARRGGRGHGRRRRASATSTAAVTRATRSTRDMRERSIAGWRTAGMIDLHANKVSMPSRDAARRLAQAARD